MSDLVFVDRMAVELLNHTGDDRQLARAAWVSTSAEPDDPSDERVFGLLRALVRQKHGSVFEHAQLTFRCVVTLNVRSEHHRHRVGWSYNEMSGRYTPYSPHFYLPPADRPMVKAPEHKGMRPVYGVAPIPLYEGRVESSFRHVCREAWECYQQMLDDGIAGELARMVLPGCLLTTYWATCNPRSLMHFLSLRTHEPDSHHPSFPMVEMEQVARQMEGHFAERFPLTYRAFVENGREAP